MTVLGGIDIGGTKCAVIVGLTRGDEIDVIGKRRFPTPTGAEETLDLACIALADLLHAHPHESLAAIGISCGGPLDSRAGLVLAPPNLPGWDRVDVLAPFRSRFDVPVALQNDANACALAEWRWGAGRGCRNVVFLTFGTGMGAGLVLDGRLYSGTNDLAGEVGHMRLESDGPIGYGKAGSFEGFCSGGGIANLARSLAAERLSGGGRVAYCATFEDLPAVTAESVARAADQGDETAIEVFDVVAHQLGRGLAILVDVLNPQRIVIGSIFARQRGRLEERMLDSLRAEALPGALSVCEVVPAGLGEAVGDLASLSVALEATRIHEP